MNADMKTAYRVAISSAKAKIRTEHWVGYAYNELMYRFIIEHLYKAGYRGLEKEIPDAGSCPRHFNRWMIEVSVYAIPNKGHKWAFIGA